MFNHMFKRRQIAVTFYDIIQIINPFKSFLKLIWGEANHLFSPVGFQDGLELPDLLLEGISFKTTT